MPPKKTGARKGRGKAVLPLKETAQPPPEPEPEPQNEPVTEASQDEVAESRARSPNPSLSSSINLDNESVSSTSSESAVGVQKKTKSPKKKRKIKEHAGLTQTQEEDMFEWLKINPVIYSRGMSGYKNVEARNKLWSDKAEQMGKSVKQIKDIWYKSVRSRVGRLVKKKSGTSQFDVENCSDRDKYLMDKMQFLIPHIHEVKKRPTVSVSSLMFMVPILTFFS
ncbi:hypothetical protein FSP39_019477 [Pinctada imbricata]|uniref:MADF domain-containing protein n=1 Tax=Pinctada imbricata TaxID=66713 RepID=A0AA89C0J1_PINIB|nr:hypothetical protein FSP39_019477 [Pinctada imbricata]